MWDILIFIITLFLPFTVLRIAGRAGAARIIANPPRTGIGLRIHHFHYGIGLIVLASIILLSQGNSLFSIVPLGLGLGLVLDEFIASLYLEQHEPDQTKRYVQSAAKTSLVLVVISVTIILLSLLF